jgi:3-hydroxyacyl-[acyl-carrier-protein] dehydratase
VRYLLVDRIERVEPGKAIVGCKVVAMSEDYLEHHFPGQPVVPGVLVLEAFVQLAGWLEAASSDFASWFLLDRVGTAKWYGPNGPGERIDLSLEVVPATDPARRAYRGEATVGGERRASVEFEGTTVPLDSLDDRTRVAGLYRALRGEGPARDARKGRP